MKLEEPDGFVLMKFASATDCVLVLFSFTTFLKFSDIIV